jgi:phage shock protein A
MTQSGALEDAGGHTNDIQEELDEAASAADVDRQLAALKAKLAAPPATPELPSGDSPAASPAKE